MGFVHSILQIEWTAGALLPPLQGEGTTRLASVRLDHRADAGVGEDLQQQAVVDADKPVMS